MSDSDDDSRSPYEQGELAPSPDMEIEENIQISFSVNAKERIGDDDEDEEEDENEEEVSQTEDDDGYLQIFNKYARIHVHMYLFIDTAKPIC